MMSAKSLQTVAPLLHKRVVRLVGWQRLYCDDYGHTCWMIASYWTYTELLHA